MKKKIDRQTNQLDQNLPKDLFLGLESSRIWKKENDKGITSFTTLNLQTDVTMNMIGGL